MPRSAKSSSIVARFRRQGPIAWVLCLVAGLLGPMALSSPALAATQTVTSVVATPSTQTVHQTATITATISPGLAPLLGDPGPAPVNLTVISGPNTGTSISGCVVTLAALALSATQCTTGYTSSLAGTDTIEADAAGQTGGPTTTVTWKGIPGFIVVDPPSMSFDTVGIPAQVTATVFDQNAALLPGATVNFTVTGAGATTHTGTTDASGNAVLTFTSGVTGTSTVTAQAQGASGAVTASTTIQWAGPPATIALSQTDTSHIAPVGGTDVISANVQDASGLEVGDNTTVTFTVSGVATQTVTARTSGGGASFSLTSAVTGTSTVVATAGAATSNSVTVTWQAPTPTAVFLTPGGAVDHIGSSQLLVATVLDQFGQPIAGALVRFRVTGANAQPFTSSAITPSSGQAGFQYTGNNLGLDTVSVFVDLNSNGVADAGEPNTSAQVAWTQKPGQGYWLVATDGGIFAYGPSAPFEGSAGAIRLNQPILGIAATASGQGYWLVASDGGIFSYGDARFFGSTGSMRLNQPIVGMARTASGNGYWLAASDGGIFAYGDARFFGSTGSIHLNKPIVGMAATPSGNGYWLVASDGGIFAYGDANPNLGSLGATPLNSPIVGMAATHDGGGYWLVAADGGVFAFGNAHPWGSLGSTHLNSPIVGIAAVPDDSGYYLVGADGGVFNFPFTTRLFGSAGGLPLNKPIVGITIAP